MNEEKSHELTFILECLVNLTHIAQRGFSFESESPVLDVLEYVSLDSVVQSGDLQNGNKVVNELSGSYFDQEMVTAVLDAYVCKLAVQMSDARRGVGERAYAKSKDLYVGVLVVKTALEGAHGVLCRGRL